MEFKSTVSASVQVAVIDLMLNCKNGPLVFYTLNAIYREDINKFVARLFIQA